MKHLKKIPALTAFSIFLTGLVFSGCSPSGPPCPPRTAPSRPPDTTATASSGDLALSIQLPKTTFRPGEKFRLKITAFNRAADGLRIRGEDGSAYYVHLCRHDGVAWKRVKTYPRASPAMMNEWVIPPAGARNFIAELIVEPDWPTHENLRLEVNINGREDVSPYLHIEVTGPKDEKK